MAKKSKIAKNEQRKVLVERYAEKRAELPQNGLRVVVMPDTTTEMVEVDIR